MTDLADGVVYSRSGLTYQAGLLEKAGLVTRTPSPDDERSVTVTITDAGRALLAKVLPGHTEVISQLLFEPLSRDDAKALADLLAPVRDHMRSTPPRSAAPRRRKGARTRRCLVKGWASMSGSAVGLAIWSGSAAGCCFRPGRSGGSGRTRCPVCRFYVKKLMVVDVLGGGGGWSVARRGGRGSA